MCQDYLNEIGENDIRTYNAKKAVIKSQLKELIPDIQFKNAVCKNIFQPVYVSKFDNFSLDFAIKASEEDKNYDIVVARRCTRILGKTLLKINKKTKRTLCNGGMSTENQTPSLMVSFLSWILAGE